MKYDFIHGLYRTGPPGFIIPQEYQQKTQKFKSNTPQGTKKKKYKDQPKP